MRRLLAASLLLTASTLAFGPAAAQERVEPRVILISIDGLMPSSYTDPALAPYTPHLRALAQGGVWADGLIGVLPSVTYPSHTTLITGVEPARHGIYDNRILDPEGRSNGGWYSYAEAIKVPTLPMAARARGLRAGAVTWPVTIGMDLDYLAPEYLGPRHEQSLSMLGALSAPRGLLSAAAIARGAPFSWPQTDRDRTDISTFILKTYDPHVFLLHLIELDSTQHTYGPGSPEALKMLAKVDGHLGEIIEAVRMSGRAGVTTIAVASDHGFLPVTQMVQPNAALKQAGLLQVSETGAVTDWRAYYHASGGAGFVYVKEARDLPAVEALLTSIKADPANGIREIWNREQLAARGAHPEAAFGLDVLDGFYTGAGHDVLVKPTTTKGGHGFAPDRPALHGSLVIAGAGVARRGTLGVVRMTQVAPTLAAVLDVSLAPDAAQPLHLGTDHLSSGKEPR
ncbi:MAG: ectonucleotide pyrophosphatase/phosphodiesterase [Vicinamibacterales bacterium]|nr:ectonucleotide pyrophosphatase/phosphodiesterase [Vicinamibacterales bacterium]